MQQVSFAKKYLRFPSLPLALGLPLKNVISVILDKIRGTYYSPGI